MNLKQLFENDHRQKLLTLQARVIDLLPDDCDVSIERSNEGLAVKILYPSGRILLIQPRMNDNVDLIIKNETDISGPYPLVSLIKDIEKMSEGAYRALIIDNEWRSRRDSNPR